jgi:hypothetical protein
MRGLRWRKWLLGREALISRKSLHGDLAAHVVVLGFWTRELYIR